jgi:hypothetical protein
MVQSAIRQMKYLLIIFLLPFTSKGQYIPEQDSIGYVQPWLSERGEIVWMNALAMDIRNVEYDTLNFWIEFEFPPGQAPYSTKIYIEYDSLVFEPTIGLPCYAIKGTNSRLGQVWVMLLPNHQRVEALLIRGFRTTRIVQTGQK